MKKILFERIGEHVFMFALIGASLLLFYCTLPSETLLKFGIKKPEVFVEFFGYGAAISFATIALILFRTAVTALFPGWDLKEYRQGLSLSDRASLYGKIILAIAIIIAASISAAAQPEPPHIRIARSYLSVREHPANSNAGKEVEMFLRYTGLGKGNPWCAAYVSFCLGRANVKYPLIVSAAARRFVTDKSIPAAKVLSGQYKLKGGEIVIWQRGNGWAGHVGFVIAQLANDKIRTIEGNTSSGEKGSQFDGGGVYERTRVILPTSYFQIIYFTPVDYA